ncbi:MAG: ferritin-like domain-containing protein [Elusimicrobia bacterium]|nr:ferritin-like domain-containing protein [Elusimicrobiota bacterium]
MAGKNDPKLAVIEVLNKARADELSAIFQYMSQHYALADGDYGEVAAQVKRIAIDEMRHAEMFAERVYELGGVPVSEPSMKTKKSQSIGEAMDYNVELEEKALADYNSFQQICVENRDSLSAKLFETIIDEEQAHLNYFQNIARHIRELGGAYLAQIAGGPGDVPASQMGFVAQKASAGKAG